MIRKALFPALLVLIPVLAAGWASGQTLFNDDDFLTNHEVDIIRQTQEPNARIEQYLQFARLRLELVRQQLAEDKPGRSPIIHDNLDEYRRIIQTIDIVIDDALMDGADVTPALEMAVEQEKAFLKQLEGFKANPEDDHWRYEFVLNDAIMMTRDSIELSQSDIGERKQDIAAKDERMKQERERLMTPARREEVQAAREEQQEKEEEQKRKRPSLLKQGEKPKLDR